MLSLSLAVSFVAVDVCSDMARQVAGRLSYACAAGERYQMGGKSRTSCGRGLPAGLRGTCKGKVVLPVQHGTDLGPVVKFPCA